MSTTLPPEVRERMEKKLSEYSSFFGNDEGFIAYDEKSAYYEGFESGFAEGVKSRDEEPTVLPPKDRTTVKVSVGEIRRGKPLPFPEDEDDAMKAAKIEGFREAIELLRVNNDKYLNMTGAAGDAADYLEAHIIKTDRQLIERKLLNEENE